MAITTNFENKIGVLDPGGLQLNPLTNEPYTDIYKILGKVWSSFPAFKKAADILTSIAENQITFIISGTGSGKTVLIPKFALHYLNYDGKIAITLPKRVVTLSAAAFAAKTLDVDLGRQVGYIYKGSPREVSNPNNKLVYMTDGTLIMKYVADPLLLEYNIIIIDEAHERKIQIDLILLFLKLLLQSGKRPDLRVIIMSATIDGKKYQKYFSGVSSQIINISGQPNHEIKTHFLDKPSKSYMADGLELIEELVAKYPTKDMLFFITTSNEAIQLCRTIRPAYPKVFCIEVFADMDKDLKLYAETRDKYLELGNYEQKLVMATNVAESSLTIDGLTFVIDSGYELYSSFDPEYFGGTLEKRLITKAQALQRRGRVGRTEPGICYHLLTKLQFEELENYPVPDILRQDITLDLIKIIRSSDEKTYNAGINIMNQLMDPPTKPYTDIAHQLLNMYAIIDTNEKITSIGYKITQFSSIPINRSLFLIYAYEMHCAKEASIILAMMDSLKNKLSNLFFKADTLCDSNCSKPAAKNLIEKLVQKKGDHLTFLKIYQEFKAATDQKIWARKYGIRMDMLNKADRDIKSYYYKIISAFKNPQIGGWESSLADTNKRLIEALRKSHQHLTAKRMVPVFPKKKANATINKDSALYYYYNRKKLATKNFIYDELTNINGNWEFNMVTII